MKKYVIILAGVAFLLLVSIIFKYHNKMVCHHFPIPKNLKKNLTTSEVPLYLFFFFSKKDCLPCVREVLEILNPLQPNFVKAGILPEEEFDNKKNLKNLFDIPFPLYSDREFKNYLPWHTPTLFGVSPSGKILFILPGINGGMDYLNSTLNSIYGKLHISFLTKEK